ncbi:DUF2322 family protein [Paludibacterium paludis]|uniref:DUF2322 family protein n=1 Tax=Paludibacterium paludis TaxID=1225769 RepID=A0A918P7D0_9NEIS|nr:DUF2322 family protein [Paludibacterium paludis]GGY27271.1 hypothetical protein GCM10011289_33370 [Paludibacterium paludis]
MTQSFKDILETLPAIDDVEAVILLDAGGHPLRRLDNAPGTAGSVRVYHALVKRHGHIDRKAAKEGLALYAEHVADARAHPGKHPNIDCLIAIAEAGEPGLRARIVLRAV